MTDDKALKAAIGKGDYRALARALTYVENDISPASALLKHLDIRTEVPVIGITGPPGAGKSTLVNALVTLLTAEGKKIAILAVDPTSPFNFGSLLGDRVRMSAHFNNPGVFIRSVATRGALGGISAKTLEMCDVLRASDFDLIFVETVGVGQSEVEIAGLADKTVVVLVPEAGDEIQHIKSGLMEIAQAFVVNKADREGAQAFANNLHKLLRQQHQDIPVFRTVADKHEGIRPLAEWLTAPAETASVHKALLLADKAYRIIQHRRMSDIDKAALSHMLERESRTSGFNLYRFIEDYMAKASGTGQ